MSINFGGNSHGNIPLADGRFVQLIQGAYSDNFCGRAAWFAHGYLSTENVEEEGRSTVQVRWESLGAEEAENDADWGSPAAIVHYLLGELVAA